MPESPQTDAAVLEAELERDGAAAEEELVEESLVEEISIDGMCGVY
jgi:mycofactocin precursor